MLVDLPACACHLYACIYSTDACTCMHVCVHAWQRHRIEARALAATHTSIYPSLRGGGLVRTDCKVLRFGFRLGIFCAGFVGLSLERNMGSCKEVQANTFLFLRVRRLVVETFLDKAVCAGVLS